jgi:hypothetical protein
MKKGNISLSNNGGLKQIAQVYTRDKIRNQDTGHDLKVETLSEMLVKVRTQWCE